MKNDVQTLSAKHGFYRYDTGGGCTALHREWANHYALITQADGPEMPDTLAEPVTLGFYFNDQDHSDAWATFACDNLADAFAIVAKFQARNA